jgi:hypothetical protein
VKCRFKGSVRFRLRPLLIINCANFFKASVMQDGKTRYVKAVSYYNKI